MPDETKIPVVLIAGPTASGKTRAALDLAGVFDAEIVNADAMQVYRDIPVMSAQPTEAEKGEVAHHLFGYLDGAARCSAGRWSRDAASAIEAIRARGRTPIVVGGTGLYMTSLSEGLSTIPDIPPAVRDAVAARLEAVGLAAFRADLIARDPPMERLEANDRQRHIRAAEVLEATGRPLSAYQADPPQPAIRAAFQRVVIEPDRADLYNRINARLERMVSSGGLEEVAALKGRHLDPSLPVMKALGVPELMAHLNGEVSLVAAIDRARMMTRRFAKRQLTWFRGQASQWPRAVSPGEAVALLVKDHRS